MDVAQAVRELRKAYGEAQQAFSTRLGMSMASIANYETGKRVPDTESAIKLARAALEKKQYHLQTVFDGIIHDAMGGLISPIRDEDEHRKVRAFQFILFDDREEFVRLRKPLLKLLAPVEEHLRQVEKKLAERAAELDKEIEAYNERLKGVKAKK